MVTDTIRFQPKQELLWRLIDEDRHDEEGVAVGKIIGYGGSAGGAKSYALRNCLHAYCCKYPNSNVLLFRRHYDDIRKNHIEPMLAEHPDLQTFYHKTEKTIRYPNGSLFEFGFADNEDDIYKFQGQEYARIGADEAGLATEKQLKFLLSRNRAPKRKTAKMIMTFNPGGHSHRYLKRLFIDRIYENNEHPNDYVFIQAHMWDNVEWVRHTLDAMGITAEEYYSWSDDNRRGFTLQYADYAHQLSRLDEYMKRAYLYGDWNTYEGQFFGKFYRDIHVMEPFPITAEDKEHQNYTIVGGMDYGNTTVIELLARDRNGTIYNFAELHMEELTMSQKAKRAGAWLASIGMDGVPIYADVTMMGAFHRDTGNTDTAAELFRAEGINLIPVSKQKMGGKTFRIGCNDLIRDALYWERENGELTVKPKLYFFPQCASIIKTLPELMTDTANIEDIEQGQDVLDHDYDALKYGIIHLHTPPPAPRSEIGRYARQVFMKVKKSMHGTQYARFQ
ncbi:MAG: phage terminase large subunit [Patescibacteria group bacterium]|nr:phage terminase large subunit [Patescibacteria group bacterium]